MLENQKKGVKDTIIRLFQNSSKISAWQRVGPVFQIRAPCCCVIGPCGLTGVQLSVIYRVVLMYDAIRTIEA